MLVGAGIKKHHPRVVFFLQAFGLIKGYYLGGQFAQEVDHCCLTRSWVSRSNG